MDQLPDRRQILATKLRQGREAAGLSSRQVAKALADAGNPISHVTIGKYEKGATSPDLNTISILANLYRRDLSWFVAASPTLAGVRFRKATSLVRVTQEKVYLAQAARVLEAYQRLERFMKRPLHAQKLGFAITAEMTGEALAKRVRAKLGLIDASPLPSVIEAMEELFGVRVIELATESRIDGLAATFGGEPVVVLNPLVPNDRNRTNAGHEWGHIAFEDCLQGPTLSHKELESRVFEFLFHVLVPPDVLREAFAGKSMVKLVQYKEKYGVSMAAMIYQAQKKGVITTKESEYLWRQFAIRGWRRHEPGNVRPDRATRFERLFEEATADGESTKQHVLRIIGLEADEMQARLDLAAGMASRPTDPDDEIEGGNNPDLIKFPE